MVGFGLPGVSPTPLRFHKFDIGLNGGADALVRSRPPGRLPDGRKRLIRRGKAG